VHHPSEAAWERSASFGGASAAATGHPPPGLVVITGLGRHSRGDGGGVLKAAVRALLRQQGLPTVDDPGNEGARACVLPPACGCPAAWLPVCCPASWPLPAAAPPSLSLSTRWVCHPPAFPPHWTVAPPSPLLH
jgi:hypothetical protein